MVTLGEKLIAALTVLLIISAGAFFAVVHPRIDAGAAICAVILVAGGVMMFRDAVMGGFIGAENRSRRSRRR